MSLIRRIDNANHNALTELNVHTINLTKPVFAYVRIHTELKLNQVFELLESVTIEGNAATSRKMSGVQWNMYMLLTGHQVKHSKADEAYFIPVVLLPGDVRVLLAWNTQLLVKDELRAKLQVGDPPRLLVYPNLLPNLPALETLNWRLTEPQDIPIVEEKQHPTEKKYVLFQAKIELPRDRPIAQVVFYGNVTSQNWLKKGELVVDEKVVADFCEPYECTVFDRERWGMPHSSAAIFTFTFANYFLTSPSNSEGTLQVHEHAWLKLTLEPQFMPQKPNIQLFCVTAGKQDN